MRPPNLFNSLDLRVVASRRRGASAATGVLGLFLSAVTSGEAETVQNFDAPGTGSSFVLAQFLSPPEPAVLAGGACGSKVGRFLRLTSGDIAPPPPRFNTVTFDRTDDGSSARIVADFDLRIRPRDGRADGLGFALLNTAFFGWSGPVGGNGEEPNFEGSLGVGFDVFKNHDLGDSGNENIRPKFSNTVSVHFDSAVVVQVDATPVVDLASGRFVHVRILLEPGKAMGKVSVFLTPCDAAEVLLIDRLPVPGFAPYEGRVHFGARSGGETADHDVDNVNVQFLGPSESVLSFGSLSYVGDERGRVAALVVRRAGALQRVVRVHYSTTDLTAHAGSDYQAVSGVLTFPRGVSRRSIRVPILDDSDAEGDEVLMVRLNQPSAGAVLGGPSEAAVTLVDDEDAGVVGRWSRPFSWPLVSVHMHLLPTQRVLLWDRLGVSRLWDHARGLTRPARQPKPDYNTFCSGHTFLSDGKLLVTGGHMGEGEPAHDGEGIPRASLYDPFRDSWKALPDMNAGRWYPTNTTLANGDVLVISGSQDTGYGKNLLAQVWQTAAGAWRDLTDAESQPENGPALGVDLYPRMFLAPGGPERVFKAGPDQDTWFLDTSGGGSWSPGPPSNYGLRTYGTAVMYAPGKVLLAGGGDPPTASAEVIDLNALSPQWQSVDPMSFARRQHNATILPDGRVLVTGGTSGPGFNDELNPVLAAELWDPATGTWDTLPDMEVTRGYHSTALLLPDGRVLSGGGGQGAGATSFHNNGETYSPPYLFKGPRPRITGAPARLIYGRTAFIRVSGTVAKVSLIRLPSVTHSMDQNSRFVPLDPQPAPGGIRITAPPGPNVAPPGHYMLFVLNGSGVPSVAKVVRLMPAS